MWPSPAPPIAFKRLGSSISTARPASLASPGQASGSAPGSGEGLCRARRGSRRRSTALRASFIEPNQTSPSLKETSMPLIRGAPSLRSVASVLWRAAAHTGPPAGGGYGHALTALAQRRRVLPGALQRLGVGSVLDFAVGEGEQGQEVDLELAAQDQRRQRQLVVGAVARREGPGEGVDEGGGVGGELGRLGLGGGGG